ncbi:hypothetical protein RMSM_07143 [Rhodopirellula maiorica SM1]|uniref:Uncharacterized protein n=1 Tax=Rhodopirellula maiorica SM1 TaxID=1265738 RepID=M5RPN9_9BACT|nr:hypothetical protein RMSM_07143 [Rhodopirellula maiorica SM1]
MDIAVTDRAPEGQLLSTLRHKYRVAPYRVASSLTVQSARV